MMTTKEFYRTIFSFFKKRKLQVFLYFFLMGINLVFGLIEPYFSARLMTAITSICLDSILWFAGILLGISLIEQVVDYIRRESEYDLEEQITLDTQEFVSKELFLLEQKNFDTMGTSFFSSRMNGDTSAAASFFFRVSRNLSWTLKSFGVLIYIFMMSVPIGIYIFIGSGILSLLRYRSMQIRKKQRKEEDRTLETYASSFNEIIRGIRDIKVLNLKDEMIKKTLHDQKCIHALNKEHRHKMFLRDEVNWGIQKVIDFGVYVLAIYLMSKDLFLGTNLVILYTYKGRAFGFLENLSSLLESVFDVRYSFERLYEIVDGKTYSKEKYGTKHISKLKGDIEFKNVSFSYNLKEEALKEVSFHIKPNETVGIVGKSGAGKSTIFGLIPKLYTCKEGEILLDGISITDLDEKTIRENISVITQNPYLFNMTIKENLKIVKTDASDAEMIRNCKLCAFHEYVMTLPKGYDTLIGEGGVILSGGLRQRLAIARALMKKSEIILLDEATSALDNETQDFIKHSIHKISKNYTILIIAHRLSTVRDCDYLFVVEDGKIVGKGTHDVLIKKNKYYKKLYEHELL